MLIFFLQLLVESKILIIHLPPKTYDALFQFFLMPCKLCSASKTAGY
jgi:hypothetical protein